MADTTEEAVALAPAMSTRPWLHELFDNLTYRWVVENQVMRNDEHGVELTYRRRRRDDVVCGARTVRPGIPGCTSRWKFQPDRSVDHEVVCNWVGDHGEAPHVGAPAECVDMTCRCAAFGSYHLALVGFTVSRTRRGVGEDG